MMLMVRVDPAFRYPKEHYEEMGRILSEDILALHAAGGQSVPAADVGYARRCFRAPRRQPTEENLRWAERMLSDEGSSKVNRRLAVELERLHAHPRRTELVEMQALRIGSTCIVGFPGEPFSDIGLRLRRRAPFGNLMISELANNELGYFATEPAYSAGVYEAILPSAPFTQEVIDRMIDEAEQLLHKLYRKGRQNGEKDL